MLEGVRFIGCTESPPHSFHKGKCFQGSLLCSFCILLLHQQKISLCKPDLTSGECLSWQAEDRQTSTQQHWSWFLLTGCPLHLPQGRSGDSPGRGRDGTSLLEFSWAWSNWETPTTLSPFPVEEGEGPGAWSRTFPVPLYGPRWSSFPFPMSCCLAITAVRMGAMPAWASQVPGPRNRVHELPSSPGNGALGLHILRPGGFLHAALSNARWAGDTYTAPF